MGYAMAYACWACNTGHDWLSCTWFIHFEDMQWARDFRLHHSANEGS